MGLVYASIYLVVLSLLGLAAVWFFFFKMPNKAKPEDLCSPLDKDLIKTNASADIHRNRFYLLLLAFFIVSIYTYKLITYEEVILHEVIKKKKPRKAPDNEVVVLETEIKDPEPPKPQIIKVPKVVTKKTPPPPKDSLPPITMDDDFFDDEDPEPEPEPETEQEAAPTITDVPGVMPEFLNGGEVGLDNTVILLLEDQIPQFPPGFYPVNIEFVVELNGTVSNVRLLDEDDIENMEIAKLVMNAFKRAGRFAPGSKDGQDIRVIMNKMFFIEIEP